MLSNDIFMNTITNEDFGVFDKIRNVLTKFGKGASATVTQNPIIDPDSLRKGLGTSGSGTRIISAPATQPVTSKPKMIPTHVSSKPKPIIATSSAGKRVAVSTSMTI